jgi:hypothetical protein
MRRPATNIRVLNLDSGDWWILLTGLAIAALLAALG